MSAAEFQLSNQSEVRRSEAGIEILFNQFVMRDSEGIKNFVCRVEGRPGVFDQIEVSFRGTGISEAGKVPRLTVLAECFSSPSALKVGAIRVFIPMKEITELRPIDQEVVLQGAQIKITQMVSEWPLDWVIDGINYLNSTSNNSKLSLEMKKGEGPASKALSFSWPIRSFEPTPRKF